MQKIINRLSWKIGGEAGDGILNAGLLMFGKTCLRSGLNIFATAEYPSLIRGGHNNLDICVSDEDIFAHTRKIDLLVALNKDTIDRHKWRMSHGGGIIYDGDEVKGAEFPEGVRLYALPLYKIANEHGGK